MPLVAQTLSSSMQSQFYAKNYKGKNVPDLVSCVGDALAVYLVTPNLVTAYVSGTAGLTGSIVLSIVAGVDPTSMSSYMNIKAQSKKMTGRDITGVFSAISLGIVPSLYGMVLTGSTVGVAVGTGTGNFTALSDTVLSGNIYQNMLLKQLKGKNNMDLADCIAYGICTHLQTVSFTVVVAGVIAPTPPTGPVTVMGIPTIYTKIS